MTGRTSSTVSGSACTPSAGLSGMALTAAAADSRIKAAATSSMCDMSLSMSRSYQDSYTPEQRQEVVDHLSRQRWADTDNGTCSINSTTAWTATTPMAFFAFPLMANIGMLAPRPALLVAGADAHSRY